LDGWVRVLLVDDHAIVRRGLREVIAEAFADSVFGEAGSESEALALGGTWDLAIVDLSLRQRGGLDLVQQLKARTPALRVLVVSMQDERAYGVRALRAGASGFVSKDVVADALPQAIRTVIGGGVYASPAVTAQLVSKSGASGELPHHGLSDRELQVLCAIGRGRSVKQIAVEFALSEKTISTYRTRLLEKLQLAGTAELIRYAIEHQLV
jgi:DNA-binding NarL/FixJ family response regulator